MIYFEGGIWENMLKPAYSDHIVESFMIIYSHTAGEKCSQLEGCLSFMECAWNFEYLQTKARRSMFIYSIFISFPAQ